MMSPSQRWMVAENFGSFMLTCVVEFHRNLARVDQLRLDVRTLLCLLKNKARSVFASPSLTSGPKNHRNKKWAFHSYRQSSEAENGSDHSVFRVNVSTI